MNRFVSFVFALAVAGPLLADSVRGVLDPVAGRSPRTEVLVLGTPHLASVEGFQPRFASPVIDVLETFRPTIVCVEVMPGEDLAAMEEAGGASEEIAEMFAKEPMALGRGLRESMKVSRLEALRRAGQIRDGRAPSNDERAKLVSYLMAAYDYSSAMLQWSYLPAEFRASTPLVPDEVKAWLEKRLASNNELATVAIPLARRLGLQSLEPVDSHRSAAKLLAAGEEAMAELFGHPLQKEASKAAVYSRSNAAIASGVAAEDFLPVYRHFNSSAYLDGDVEAQWAWYWKSRLDSGLDRLRFALWERRNIDIAARVVEQTASARAERVLLIIGSAHKPFVEEILGRLVHVRLVEFEKLAADRK